MPTSSGWPATSAPRSPASVSQGTVASPDSSTLHDPTSRIVKAYQQTGTFLVSQGRLTSAPSAAQIAQHIDITFVKKALSGGCPS